MENEFTKEEIFGLYLNMIFFGQRSYGVAAAAEAYFGKTLDQLNVAEAATLAGIPAGALALQPDRESGARRRSGARTCCGACATSATSTPAATRPPRRADGEPHARTLYRRRGAVRRRDGAARACRPSFGDAVETAGYKVYTTIDWRLQTAADRAVRIGLIEYDRRHGWRGATDNVDLSKGASDADLEAELDQRPAGRRSAARDRRVGGG